MQKNKDNENIRTEYQLRHSVLLIYTWGISGVDYLNFLNGKI